MTTQIISKRSAGNIIISPLLQVPDVISGVFTRVQNASVGLGGYAKITDNNGEYVTYNCYFSGGFYQCRVWAVKSTASPILDVRINDVDVFSSGIDLYATANYLTVWSQNLYIAEGFSAVKFIADGKNTSSSDYNALLCLAQFNRRTSL